jgi:hypothetical protein
MNTQKESKEAKEQLANTTRDIWRAFSLDLLSWGGLGLAPKLRLTC